MVFIIWKQVTLINFFLALWWRFQFFNLYFNDLIIGFSAVFWNSLLGASSLWLLLSSLLPCPVPLLCNPLSSYSCCSCTALGRLSRILPSEHKPIVPSHQDIIHSLTHSCLEEQGWSVCGCSSSVCQCLPEFWQLQAIVALPVLRGWGIAVMLILQLHNAAMSLLDASAHVQLIACLTAALWILWRFLLARTSFHRQPHPFSLLRQRARAFYM